MIIKRNLGHINKWSEWTIDSKPVILEEIGIEHVSSNGHIYVKHEDNNSLLRDRKFKTNPNGKFAQPVQRFRATFEGYSIEFHKHTNHGQSYQLEKIVVDLFGRTKIVPINSDIKLVEFIKEPSHFEIDMVLPDFTNNIKYSSNLLAVVNGEIIPIKIDDFSQNHNFYVVKINDDYVVYYSDETGITTVEKLEANKENQILENYPDWKVIEYDSSGWSRNSGDKILVIDDEVLTFENGVNTNHTDLVVTLSCVSAGSRNYHGYIYKLLVHPDISEALEHGDDNILYVYESEYEQKPKSATNTLGDFFNLATKKNK
jgi:hypothetical protein